MSSLQKVAEAPSPPPALPSLNAAVNFTYEGALYTDFKAKDSADRLIYLNINFRIF